MDAANDNTVYLTPEQVSARYQGKIAVRTLANWRCLGIGPRYSKIGGAILYPLDELVKWERDRRSQSTSTYKRAG